MATLLRKTLDFYNYINYEVQDDRTKDWFPSVIVLTAIMWSYLYFCKTLGPRIMKDMPPFMLKNTILTFNLFQIFINVYLISEVFLSGWIFDNSLICQPVDYTNKPSTLRFIRVAWLYMMVKLIDLLDTVFFVLRKKNNQISGLHLYHHFMMPIVSFFAVKYYPHGHSTFLGIINSFVHIIMYTYYLISGLGPKYQKYLWWKRYVTILQMIQFFIIFCHNIFPLFIECDYPRWINVLLAINSWHFVYMFGKFYYENYIKKAKKQCESKFSNGKSKND